MNVIIDRITKEATGELTFDCCCQFEATVVNISMGRSWAIPAHPGEVIIEILGQMDSVRHYEGHLHVFLEAKTRYNLHRAAKPAPECDALTPRATDGAA